MTGTLVNAGAVIAGSLIGLLAKKWIKPALSDGLMKIIGLATLLIGLGGTFSYMLKSDSDGVLSSEGGMLLLLSLVLGALLGELLKIEDGIARLSGWVERKMRLDGFAKGFVSATLLFCVGAMTVVGAFNDGLNNDPSLLLVKSAMDCASAVFLSAALGAGVLFAFIPLLLYQGALSLCAGLLAPVLVGETLSAVCLVGYALIVAIGLNLIGLTRFKTANLLPALVVAALAAQLPWL